MSVCEPGPRGRATRHPSDLGKLPFGRVLACALLPLFVAVGGAAVSAGCLVTDPVPYEPAENIPPIILPGVQPDPLKLVVSTAGATENIELRLTVPVLEYNLDDTLYYSLVWQNCGAIENLLGRYSIPPPAERSRTRTISRTVNLSPSRLGPVSGVYCGRVLLAVSDRGWTPDMPPLCSPPQDEEGRDLTVVPIVQWWVLKDVGTTADGPGVKTCGEAMTPPQE